jgi:cytochrome c-type biogenesis protein CcmH
MKKILIFLFLINISTAHGEIRNDKLKIEITKNLRCLICQGQSVYDSDSEFANSVKLVVEDKLNEGMEEEEIYIFLKEKYGNWILYDPELSKNTYILWILPLLLFLIGGAIIIRKLNLKKN